MTRRLSGVALNRLHDLMAGYVARGDVPGVVTLVSRGSETHVDAIGVQTIGGEAMRRTSIFRIASMTKPITAAAAMILVENGLLELDEPIDRLLPELSARRVLKRIDGPLDDTVPAIRSITVRDLLTFRMGFGASMQPSGSMAIQKAVGALELRTGAPPKPATPHAPDEWLRRFGTLPLMHQPGEAWMYDTAAHVLGVLIARASGQSLEAFLRQRIFDPLGMSDTGFSVPETSRSRLVSCYQFNPSTRILELHDGVDDSQWSQPVPFPDAAGGLVSTVDDYLAFATMLLEQGRHGGEPLLTPASVEAMTTNQLTPDQQAAAREILDDGGWGFGLSVVASPGERGRYGWDGAYGTSWSSDPAQKAIAVLMTQRLFFPVSSGIERDFREAAWDALLA